MRTNLPVTNREYVLDPGTIIVSNTDLHGNITYINQAFIAVSGFEESELIGFPQNIIRHPDMPPAAFADFWLTLRAGKVWTGLVKNRCKNGDFYWVEATAGPIMRDGNIIGYTSIRITARRDQIDAANTAYQAINNGNQVLSIHQGKVRPKARFYFSDMWGSVSLTSKLHANSLLTLCLFLAMCVNNWINNATTIWSLSIATIGIICSFLFNAMMRHDIILPLTQASRNIDALSEGNLTEHLSSNGNDEVGKMTQSLRILQINIKLLVSQIRESSLLVTCGANEIAVGNNDLSIRTESQACTIEETAASMEELTATIRHNADNLSEINQLVSTTSTSAAHGGDNVLKIVTTMELMRESSRKISDIIGVIDGIAFQTNILALNAAVEAARAGEQGRGFAVVATEVRALAQRSAGAAKEIKLLIHDSVDNVNIIGEVIDDAGKTMTEIVKSIAHVASIMTDITLASREQSQGIEQVNITVSLMDEITQKNATLVEEAAAASESLRDQSDMLINLVNAFKIVT